MQSYIDASAWSPCNDLQAMRQVNEIHRKGAKNNRITDIVSLATPKSSLSFAPLMQFILKATCPYLMKWVIYESHQPLENLSTG